MQTQSTENLSELIRKKHQVLSQLRDVGLRQSALIAGGDIASVLKLLSAKQQLITALQMVERELTPYYGEDPERRAWSSPQARASCAALVTDCNTLLDEIVRMEKQGAEQMTTRRNDVAQQLQQVHSAKQVRSAYEANRRTNAAS